MLRFFVTTVAAPRWIVRIVFQRIVADGLVALGRTKALPEYVARIGIAGRRYLL